MSLDSYPDHVATHGLLLLLGDRVDSWTTRVRRVAKVVAPLAFVAFVARGMLAGARSR